MAGPGWIIEADGLGAPPERYLCLSGGWRWTPDPAKALRFVRQSDAAAVAALFVPGPHICRRYEEDAHG
jgi:hypothetical protein